MGESRHIWLDPSVIYFTHAKISRSFSGCGRRINDTIQEIIDGFTTVDQLPTITVLQCGSLIDGSSAFFTLNNRRLYVLKHLRSIGYFEQADNKVRVRLKVAKKRELERYNIDRCSLTASFMGQQEETDEDRDNDWDGFLYKKDEGCVDCDKLEALPKNTTSSKQKKEVTYEDLSEKTKKEYSKMLGLAQKGKVKEIRKLLDNLVARSELSKEHRIFIENELEVL